MDDLVPRLRDQQVQGAVKNLVVFSLAVIAVPLAAMFLLKDGLFLGLLGWDNSDASLYAAIIAVILVHVVLGLWVYQANKVDQAAEVKKKD